MPKRSKFNKKDINATLPDLSQAPKLIRDRAFIWSLLPWDENHGEYKIQVKYTYKHYDYTSITSWPLNTDNYKKHYISCYSEALNYLENPIDSIDSNSQASSSFLDIKPLDKGNIKSFFDIVSEDKYPKR